MHARGRENALMTRAADLKENQTLIFELNFFVIETTRQQHRAIGTNQILAREPFERGVARRHSTCGSFACLSAVSQRRSLHGGPNYIIRAGAIIRDNSRRLCELQSIASFQITVTRKLAHG